MYPLNLPDPEVARSVFISGAVFVAAFCLIFRIVMRGL